MVSEYIIYYMSSKQLQTKSLLFKDWLSSEIKTWNFYSTELFRHPKSVYVWMTDVKSLDKKNNLP